MGGCIYGRAGILDQCVLIHFIAFLQSFAEYLHSEGTSKDSALPQEAYPEPKLC